MTSWHSLLACAQADVTIERITSLAATTGTEPLTVDFKEKATPRLADCVASMANAHGGLILVGITDTDRKIVGVKTETMAHVADMLATRLDPADWLPEMFEVPLGDEQPGMHVLVIRIRRELAPRPVLVQRTIGSGDDKASIFWIPVRIPGGTRQATRAEMAALFAEQPAAAAVQPGHWDFDAPQIPSGKDGQDDLQVDMVLKTGLRVPPGPACPGRPLSERAISELATALDKSPLAETLFTLTGLTDAGLHDTHRRGRPNTSGTATLVWQIASGQIPPAEMTVRVEAPGQYGHSHIQTLNISVEIISRLSCVEGRPARPVASARSASAPGANRMGGLAQRDDRHPYRAPRRRCHRRSRRRRSDPGAAAKDPAPGQQPRDRWLPAAATAAHPWRHWLTGRPSAGRPRVDPGRPRRQSPAGDPLAMPDRRDAGLTGMESLVTQLPLANP